MPLVDIHTIGAGGGSLAWLEAGGLRVGPQSAGADPGPACYGRGGTPAHGHGREPVPGPARLGLLPGRPDERSTRPRLEARSSRSPRRSGSARPSSPRGCSRSSTRAWRTRCGRSLSSRESTPASTRSSRSEEPARCTPSGLPRSSRSERSSFPGAPARSLPGGCCRPTCATTSSGASTGLLPSLEADDVPPATFVAARGGGLGAARGGGHRRRRPVLRPLGRHALRRARNTRSTSRSAADGLAGGDRRDVPRRAPRALRALDPRGSGRVRQPARRRNGPHRDGDDPLTGARRRRAIPSSDNGRSSSTASRTRRPCCCGEHLPPERAATRARGDRGAQLDDRRASGHTAAIDDLGNILITRA